MSVKGKNPISPILVTGMHRSGTTLVSKYLNHLGVYTGFRKDVNNESRFFIRINNWILSQYKSFWDMPKGFNTNSSLDEMVIHQLKEILQSFWRYEYFGTSILRNTNFFNMNSPWGWKDPRNSIVIRLWLNIFPNSAIIHVVRNPIDVTNSLIQREKKSRVKKLTFTEKYYLKLLIPVPILSDYVHFGIDKKEYLTAGYELWKNYNTPIMKLLPNDKIIQIRYEDLLLNPENELTRIKDFVYKHTKFSLHNKNNFTEKLHNSRRYAFLNNNEYRKFYESIKDDDIMKKLNYENIN